MKYQFSIAGQEPEQSEPVTRIAFRFRVDEGGDPAIFAHNLDTGIGREVAYVSESGECVPRLAAAREVGLPHDEDGAWLTV